LVKQLPKGMHPLKGKGDPYSDAVRAKIKGSSSPKRKLAQKISSIPKMNPENLEKGLLEIVRNPEASALQIAAVIQDMLKKDLTDRTKVELIGKIIQAHTAIHGTQSKNLNVNIDITSDKIIERLKNYKAKEIISLKEKNDSE